MYYFVEYVACMYKYFQVILYIDICICKTGKTETKQREREPKSGS